MRTSQIVFLGLALSLVVQVAVARRCSSCNGLGSGGSNVCNCNDFVVRAARPQRPTGYASLSAINEANAARAAVAATNNGAYGCSSTGELRNGPKEYGVDDILSSSGGLIVPRFNPIGDLCHSCQKKLPLNQSPFGVRPAVPVKPPCYDLSKKSEPESCTCASSYSNPGYNLNSFDEDEGLSFDQQEDIYNCKVAPVAPADAVSLSLAYGLAQQVTKFVPEEKLFYGQRQTPQDGRVVQSRKIIPEEKLQIVERPVVELKVPTSLRSSTQELAAEEDAYEQEEEDQEAEQGPAPVITYSALGYAPVSGGNTFVNTPVEYPNNNNGVLGESNDDAACGPLGPPMPGYRGGSVDEGEDDWSREADSLSAEDDDDASSGLLARLRASARSQNGCGCA